MRKLFLTDWKCCVLRLVAILLTITTMILTTVENQAFSYTFSFIAIIFIGLSMKRVAKLAGKEAVY